MFKRILTFLSVVFLSFAILATVYHGWIKNLEREALLEYNKAQLEQNLKDQETLKKQLDDINAKQKEVQAANEAEKQAFKDKIETISSELNSKEVVSSDRPASKVIKDTVNKLKDVVK